MEGDSGMGTQEKWDCDVYRKREKREREMGYPGGGGGGEWGEIENKVCINFLQ